MDGAVVAAADVVRGLGALAGLLVIDVPGATGDIGSAFAREGRRHASRVLGDRDFVLLHVKAADESAHRGDAAGKVEAIERIDERVVGPILEGLRARADDWRLLVMPDHPTLCATRRHTDEPVPFVRLRDGRRREVARSGSRATPSATRVSTASSSPRGTP